MNKIHGVLVYHAINDTYDIHMFDNNKSLQDEFRKTLGDDKKINKICKKYQIDREDYNRICVDWQIKIVKDRDGQLMILILIEGI
jgi:hypothetical protein